MFRPRPFASLLLTVLVFGACSKDKSTPPADTKAPAPAATKAPPVTPKQVVPQGTAARPTTKKPMTGSASDAGAELAAATHVRTVQVAAYPTASPANWWASELKRQGIPGYVLQSTVNGQVVYRVRIGATVTGEEARLVAQKIHARYKWPTWITMVDDRSVLPPDGLRATRAYVGGAK
jgi:cell division septation protein DedD